MTELTLKHASTQSEQIVFEFQLEVALLFSFAVFVLENLTAKKVVPGQEMG